MTRKFHDFTKEKTQANLIKSQDKLTAAIEFLTVAIDDLTMTVLAQRSSDFLMTSQAEAMREDLKAKIRLHNAGIYPMNDNTDTRH